MGEVNVTLMLAGGHRSELRLASNDPLLRSLLATIEDKTDGGARVPPRPFHLHVEGGRRSLIFSGRDLVGLVLDPPLAIREPAPEAAVQHASSYAVIEDFLEPERHAALLRFSLAAEAQFSTSTVSTGDADYRRSHVLFDLPEIAALFRERMTAQAPALMQRFGIAPFPIAEIECQMTAHNDGNYFKLHNDNGSSDTANRAISYVYYFRGEPRGFSGGTFRLYHSRIVDGAFHCGALAADIEPRDNSLLCFPSHCHHEVLPVRCPSGHFADSRFSVNGWIRRAA